MMMSRYVRRLVVRLFNIFSCSVSKQQTSDLKAYNLARFLPVEIWDKLQKCSIVVAADIGCEISKQMSESRTERNATNNAMTPSEFINKVGGEVTSELNK